MALSLAKAAPLRPEIKLAQELSEFEATLPNEQKAKLHIYRGQSPPNPTDVLRFTAEIDRDASRNRKSRQCVGTRLTNVLHAVQQFSTVVDYIVGNSQSQLAGAIWGTVKISLQMASAISAYFDSLSTLFMRIGRTCPRYQDFGLLYPKSARVQRALCEYYVVIVRLCKQAVVFLNKPFWSQLWFSTFNPFESEFGSVHQDLKNLADAIREEISLASNQAQQDEVTEMSRFRAFVKKFSDRSTRDLEEARTWKRKKAELQFLNACSVYNHEKAWKQARKGGNTNWICDDEKYKQWKRENVPSTLWCTGILGSGKTVLSANVVEDLKITTQSAVAYFFCRHDEAESLQARTVIGSIARQFFDHIKSDISDAIPEMRSTTLDTDEVLGYVQTLLLLPSTPHEYFIILDGLDDCDEKESMCLLQSLKILLLSKPVFRVFCSSRPDVFHWAPGLLQPAWNINMSQASNDIESYVEETLERYLESGKFSVGDPTIILTIKNALLEKVHGMFLWVAFQIESICSQKTDETILRALEDLPKDLPDTFNRILRKLHHSDTADPGFCEKIFNLMAVAHRPLTLEELREAVSVNPGEITWDPSKLINDIHKALLDSCGSLVAIDEEQLTVHFAHHSVKQHLLSEPTDSDMRKYHIDLKQAEDYLGDIIVTYLNFGVFDRRLARRHSSQVANYPSAILGNLPHSTPANRLAVRFLKSRRNSILDIASQLKSAAGIVDGIREQTRSEHSFLCYAQEYWLFHTKEFKADRVVGFTLWQRLIDEEVQTVKTPWAPNKWNEFGDRYIQWIVQNEHWALINQSLTELTNLPYTAYDAGNLLLSFIETKAKDANAQNVALASALYMASCLNNITVVSLLLGKGSDVNSELGYYGNALQAASYGGHEEIVRLLLKYGVNINARGGHYGSALQAASKRGHLNIVRLLLENGADVNAKGGIHVNALSAAMDDVGFRTYRHEDTIAILLEKGADANAQCEDNRTPVDKASRCGAKAIVELLLDKGATVSITTMEAAIDSNTEEVDKMIYETLRQSVGSGTLEAEEMHTKRRQAKRRASERVRSELVSSQLSML